MSAATGDRVLVLFAGGPGEGEENAEFGHWRPAFYLGAVG